MKKILRNLPLLLALTSMVGLLGCQGRQGEGAVLIYTVDQNRIAVHKDWITYGLPLPERVDLLLLLRAGKTNEAIDRLEVLLDTAVYDALQRRHALGTNDAPALDKGLGKVIQYRNKYPRPITNAEGVYWSADRQRALDAALRQIRQPE